MNTRQDPKPVPKIPAPSFKGFTPALRGEFSHATIAPEYEAVIAREFGRFIGRGLKP